MNMTSQTAQQIGRAIRKIADKFPQDVEASVLTDIHLRVSQESGELIAFDDDDAEITRCVVEEWIDAKDEDFYEQIASVLRKSLAEHSQTIEAMSILHPFAFVLENDEQDIQHELYVVDGDTVIIDPELMKGLDKDLDDFLAQLMKE